MYVLHVTNNELFKLKPTYFPSSAHNYILDPWSKNVLNIVRQNNDEPSFTNRRHEKLHNSINLENYF